MLPDPCNSTIRNLIHSVDPPNVDQARIDGLHKGEYCTIKLWNDCGAPGMRVDPDLNTATTGFEIVTFRHSYAYHTQAETRLDFYDNGSGNKGGQFLPSYLTPEDGIVEGSELDILLTFDDIASEEEFALYGYGKPTKEFYDMELGGYSMFGVSGQGILANGVMSAHGDDCSSSPEAIKTFRIIIMATEDMIEGQELVLDVGTFPILGLASGLVPLAMGAVVSAGLYLL